MVSCSWKSSQHSQIPWTSSTESLVQINCWKVWGVEPHSEEGNTKNPYFTTTKRNYLSSFSRRRGIAWLFLLTLRFREIIPREKLPAMPMLEQFYPAPFPNTKLLFGGCGFGQFSLLGKFFEMILTTHPHFCQHSNSLFISLMFNCPKTQEKSNGMFKSESFLFVPSDGTSAACQTQSQHSHIFHHFRKHNHI